MHMALLMAQVYKHRNNEITSKSGIYQSLYHNDKYLLLCGKRQRQSFEI